jgi:hypothetical protein
METEISLMGSQEQIRECHQILEPFKARQCVYAFRISNNNQELSA